MSMKPKPWQAWNIWNGQRGMTTMRRIMSKKTPVDLSTTNDNSYSIL
jgi:hypothetical protein